MQYDSIILGSIERISDTGIGTTLNISCSWFNHTQAGCCLDSPYNFQLSIKIRQLKFVMQCSRQSDLDNHSSKKYMNNNQTICQILLSDQFLLRRFIAISSFLALNTKGNVSFDR